MSLDDPNATPKATPRVTGEATAQLPPIAGSLPHVTARGETLRVEGTNVVRVPFGVRRPRRTRPARPERWATVVLPFQPGGSTPPPPQAA
jgi:hypothetical protein